MSADGFISLSAPGISDPLLLTFDPATAKITMSSPGGFTGSITAAFDILISGLWVTKPTIISGTGINAGVIVGGSSIHVGNVDGIRANMAGAWSGNLKIYFFLP